MTRQTSKRLIKTQETQVNNILLANTAFEFPVVVTSNLIYTFFFYFSWAERQNIRRKEGFRRKTEDSHGEACVAGAGWFYRARKGNIRAHVASVSSK